MPGACCYRHLLLWKFLEVQGVMGRKAILGGDGKKQDLSVPVGLYYERHS